MLAWLSAKMGAYMASIVRGVRILVGVINFGPTCDLRGGRHWEIRGMSGKLMMNADERTFDRRVV